MKNTFLLTLFFAGSIVAMRGEIKHSVQFLHGCLQPDILQILGDAVAKKFDADFQEKNQTFIAYLQALGAAKISHARDALEKTQPTMHLAGEFTFGV